MPLASHTRLGPYEITTLLGTGGSEVYKALDTRLNRTVAIKVVKGLDAERLEHEARIIAALNNPHICAIYDVGQDYLVMEYIDGKPIKGPLPLSDCVHLAGEIAHALEAAHARGIVHRDLKPGNVLVSQGHVKLLDFGHSRQLSSNFADGNAVTMSGTVLGTAAYMSPEQARGQPADPRADIFSFGLLLYEMVSGRRAFPDETVLDLLNAIVGREPHPLETTPELQRIVMRCLNKDPARRFQSMTEVKEALKAALISTPKKQPSIAVLPFANLSGDKDNEYFCEGLTEEIINDLAQIPGLRVTARTSAFAFQKKKGDIRKIAEALNVQAVLEGSVRESGTRLRITTQLINAVDGYHLWSNSYDREKADVFEIQDDIAGAIARALHLRLYHRSTVNIPAYEAYLKARYYMWKLTPESLSDSRECYEQAIKLDPEFALAYSGFADYHLARGLVGLVPADEAMPAARASARKALDFEPSLPEAHAVLGTVATLYDFDRREAERRFELAVTREAVSSVVRILYGFYFLLARGKIEEAMKEVRRGLRDDPLNATLHHMLGVCLLETGRHTEASRAFFDALELDAHSTSAMAMLAMDYWARDMSAEALAWAERAQSVSPWHALPIGLLSGMLARSGEWNRAMKMIETLGDGQTYGAPYGLTVFHALMGEINKAHYWFERVIQQRHVAGAFQLLHSPLGKTISSGSQWVALAKTLNLYETILPAPAAV